MANYAAHTTIDVSGVIEEHVVRQAVNPLPRNRLASLPALVDRLQLGAGRMDRRQLGRAGLGIQRTVAVDTSRGSRNSCMSAFIDARVTVAAIHFQFAGMDHVTKRYWLFGA